MTHRERHTPEEAPASDGTWTPPASSSASLSPSGTTAPALGDASLWTDWYHRASPAQQQEALLKAVHEGIVYGHELAAPAHTAPPLRSLLSGLLNGQAKELAPLQLPALELRDGELDRAQSEAVARAVATPDVCLIQGLPGTGKSRVVAEIILQAAQRGERILFLAPTSAALDSVLERLAQHPTVCPIRCLAAEENLSDLPQTIARLTLPERLRHYRENTLPAARVARDAALQTLNTRLHEQVYWPQLETLAEQFQQLSERLRNLIERRDGIAVEVERSMLSLPSSAWERKQTEAMENLDGQLAGLQAELETIRTKQNQLDGEWEAIRPLVEARQGRHLWTGAWWRALLRNDLRERVRDLETRRTELAGARQRLEQDLEERRKERREMEDCCAAERCRLLDEEIAHRRAELEGEIAAVMREQDAVREQWKVLCAGLACDVIPAEISRQAVATSRTAWQQLREQDAQRAAAAEQWLQTVEEGTRTLPEKLAACANVIAATTNSLPDDTGPRLLPVFDLLVLEQAHQVTEPEFAAAARRAHRWVLIGEPDEPEALATATDLSATVPSRGRSPHAARHFFHRLWQNLHVEPCRLPFTWLRRDDRLHCRLRPIAASQEKWIETEPVVDRPEIELRILSIPRQPPQIVEVVFPLYMDLGEAKQFLFHELEELAVQTRGRGLCWFETADEVVLEFSRRTDSETRTIALGNGLSERLARLTGDKCADWHTCSLEFARAAGWTRQRAEEWIAQRLGLRSSGRTVLLTNPYRLKTPPARSSYQKNKPTDNTDAERNKRAFKMKRLK